MPIKWGDITIVSPERALSIEASSHPIGLRTEDLDESLPILPYRKELDAVVASYSENHLLDTPVRISAILTAAVGMPHIPEEDFSVFYSTLSQHERISKVGKGFYKIISDTVADNQSSNELS